MAVDPIILLPADDAVVIKDVRAARPTWTVMPLAEPYPLVPGTAPIWAFIDWLGSDMAGAERCRRLRAWQPRPVHVTMVLDGGDANDRRRAMAAGADDYLTGPLDVARILARVEQSAPIISSLPEPRLGFDDVVIDVAAHRVQRDGAIITLRPNEFRLLVHFVEHPDRVFSRAALIERLGKHGMGVDERTVDVWIGRLRRTLVAHGARDPLRTVRSYGYVFDSAVAASALHQQVAS